MAGQPVDYGELKSSRQFFHFSALMIDRPRTSYYKKVVVTFFRSGW
jgi:hypothetical protein